ncbi:TonB-dependent receptor domain-containing protein [Apibacter sp. HY039]|uniref:TonB-dependent receptor domain-containing protein n=1 Tax=Apibacter sp. HY039 TaxID=2501476 RepID=UPI000FEB9BD0|nr:TonB-dependent receptor [Apibacter sp. HY039]
MRLFISSCFIMLLPGSVFAQSKIALGFRIMDAEKACESDSTQKNILFQYEEPTGYQDVKNFISRKCYNLYHISKIPGKFRISVSSEGFEPQSFSFLITEQSRDTLDLGEYFLFRKKEPRLSASGGEKELGTITVSGVREKYVSVEANKTTYSVKNNDMLSGGSTEDALRKLPGVIKGYGGELTVNGKSMAIYIDNSPTGLSGDDLENLLQGIPATSIEKIEIINNPGAAYEANTSGGIINIVTNGRALKGINGTASLNYRANKTQRVSPSLSLNTRINKVSLQLNTGFNYREGKRLSTYNREFTYFTPSVLYNQENNDQSYNRFYFFRPSANIRFNKKSNLLINYNFNYNDISNFNSALSTSNNSLQAVNLFNDSRIKNENTNHEIIAKYRTELDSLGKNLEVTAYYSYFDKSTQNKSIQNNLGSYLYSVSDIAMDYSNFYAKANLEIPLASLDTKLNIGGKYSVANSTSRGKYNLLNSSAAIMNPPVYTSGLRFKYDDSQYALYAEANKSIGDFSVTAGLRYENLEYKTWVREYNQHTKNSLEQLYPSIGLLYKLSPVVNLNASYRKSISLPSYSSLDPNISGYFDEFNTSTGNQYLQPDYYDNYEVSVSAFNYLKLSFQYTYSKQINMLSYETEDNSLTVNQTTRTYKGMNNYNVSLGVPVPFGLISKGKDFFKQPMNIDKMSFVYLYGMYNYYKINDYPYLDKVKPLWFFALYSQIVLPLDLKLTAFYMSSTDKGYFRIYKANKPFNYSNIELSRPFYNKTVKASVGVDNLFNTSRISSTIASTNLNTHFYQRDDYRIYYLKISYNFGKMRHLKKENTLINQEKTTDPNSLLSVPELK